MYHDDREPSTLQHVQELCQTHGFSLLSNVQSVQDVTEDELVASASGDNDETSPADLRETYAPDKAELEKLLTAFEEKFADADRCSQDLEHTRDTLEELRSPKFR